MSEVHKNEIIYDEGWRDHHGDAIDEVPLDEEQPPEDKNDTGRSIPLLITIQLVLCIIAALALFIMRAMSSDLYHSFMTYYKVEMSKPVISESVFEALDITKLLADDGVKVEASPDELSRR